MTIWTKPELSFFRKLSEPAKIQAYLDSLPYNVDDVTRSPREVLRAQTVHCFDGALFAAAALELLGFPPLIVDLQSSKEDDDHILAVFKKRGHWGAVAKSNYTGCRYRDPVYRTLRELSLSYYDLYFKLAGKKTLRRYSRPYDLGKVHDIEWRTTSDNLDFLGARVDATRHYNLLSKELEGELSPADERSFRAAVLGLDVRGAHKVRGSRL